MYFHKATTALIFRWESVTYYNAINLSLLQIVSTNMTYLDG